MPNFQISKINNNAKKESLQKTLTFMHQHKNDKHNLALPNDAEDLIDRLSNAELQNVTRELQDLQAAFGFIINESNLPENDKITLYKALSYDPRHFDNILTRNHGKVIMPMTVIFSLLLSVAWINQCILGKNMGLRNDECDIEIVSVESLVMKIYNSVLTPLGQFYIVLMLISTHMHRMGNILFSPVKITENADAFGQWISNLETTILDVEKKRGVRSFTGVASAVVASDHLTTTREQEINAMRLRASEISTSGNLKRHWPNKPRGFAS